MGKSFIWAIAAVIASGIFACDADRAEAAPQQATVIGFPETPTFYQGANDVKIGLSIAGGPIGYDQCLPGQTVYLYVAYGSEWVRKGEATVTRGCYGRLNTYALAKVRVNVTPSSRRGKYALKAVFKGNGFYAPAVGYGTLYIR